MENQQFARRAIRKYYFKGDDIDFYFSGILGRQTFGGSEIGECFYATSQIDEGKPESWVEAWVQLARRVEGQGKECLRKGHTVSAREAYLRACTYYRAACFGQHPNDSRHLDNLVKSQSCFRQSASLFCPPIETVEIPFEGIVIPGYFMRADQSDQKYPTLITIGGTETCVEDLYFKTGPPGVRRGYNVLLVDLPGQGVLPFHGLFHREDTEIPIKVVMDYALNRPEVDADRLAMYGISAGGYIVTRAALTEKRIKATVANAPMIDMYKVQVSVWPPEFLRAPASVLEQDTMGMIATHIICRNYGASSPGELVEKWRDFSVEDRIKEITCPFLCMAATGEPEEMVHQAHQCYEELRVSKKDLRITTAEEGADAHCQITNLSLESQIVFNWLDEVFQQ